MKTVHEPLPRYRMVLCWNGMEGLMSFFRLVIHIMFFSFFLCCFADPAFSISFSSSYSSSLSPFTFSSSTSYSSSSYSYFYSSSHYYSYFSFFFLLLFPLYFLQAMRPMLYAADVEVISILHPCMIQLLPIMVRPIPRDIVLPLKVTHVNHMVSGLPDSLVISIIFHLHVRVHVCK